MSWRCPYGECDGSGLRYDEASNTAYDCRCRRQRVLRARARHLSGVIPRKYRGVSFDRPPIAHMEGPVIAEVRRYVRQLERNLDIGRGLWFMGDTGTGKTTLAMLVSKHALDAGRSVVIYSVPRLLNVIRETFHEGGDLSQLDLLDRLAEVDLLHLDDLGAEIQTPWVLEQLYSIVNARYENERAIVVTTNLPYEQLREEIGDRTVSRLVEICGDPLPLFGSDHRVELHGS